MKTIAGRRKCMWLQTRLFWLVAVAFGFLYGIITGVVTSLRHYLSLSETI